MASLSGGGSPRPLPTLQPQFRRRCSHIKTPHQLLRETGNYYMHIVFLQCWHTLVHRPASLCIFFLWRGREGWKPPDKNKFCNRSFAARLSPTRSPLFPITSLSLSHWLSGCTTVVWPFLVIFAPPLLLHLFCITMCKLLSCMHVSIFQRQACVIAYFADGRFTAINSSSYICRNYWNLHRGPSSFQQRITTPPHACAHMHARAHTPHPTQPSIPDLYV